MPILAAIWSLILPAVLALWPGAGRGDPGRGDGPVSNHACVMSVGEDLTYEVSWSVFKLGQIRVKTLRSKTDGGELRYVVQAFIDSYRGVPFVDLHAISTTEMDTGFYSRGYRSLEKKNGEWWGLNYLYNLPNRTLIVEQTWQKDLRSQPYRESVFDTLRIQKEWFEDALSLLYFARGRARTEQELQVPTMVYGKIGATAFRFTNRQTVEKISALEKPVRVVKFDGKAKFSGMFGLTGDFSGWFSDDEAAVPIKAKMKVILGNITIELKQWNRERWRPPL